MSILRLQWTLLRPVFFYTILFVREMVISRGRYDSDWS